MLFEKTERDFAVQKRFCQTFDVTIFKREINCGLVSIRVYPQSYPQGC